MVIRVGFEPTAIRLKVECSTTELPDQEAKHPGYSGVGRGRCDTDNHPGQKEPWVLAEAPELSQLTSKLVDRGGLEPPTYRLSSGCSNQLSYQSKNWRRCLDSNQDWRFWRPPCYRYTTPTYMAETVGFEPTEAEAHLGGLANRYLKPLGHISKTGGLGEF